MNEATVNAIVIPITVQTMDDESLVFQANASDSQNGILTIRQGNTYIKYPLTSVKCFWFDIPDDAELVSEDK